MTRPSKEAKCVILFGAVFALLTAGWQLVPRSIAGRFRPLVAEATVPPSSEWYLGNFTSQVEQFAVYDNLDGEADALKHADVLFVGDSLILFALQNQPMLQHFFGERGMRYFFLAFSAEADEIFPERIVRKFNLHPKWVIVDADDFFGMAPSPAASKAMAFGRFEGWKHRFETETSFTVQRAIHRIFPYFGMPQWDFHPQWIWYRSKTDGIMWLAGARGNAKGVRDTPAENAVWREARAGSFRSGELQAAEKFRNELESRGVRLALTWTPPNPGTNAGHLASELQVPLIATETRGLSTVDGKHLDRGSSARFTASFLAHFDKVLGNCGSKTNVICD